MLFPALQSLTVHRSQPGPESIHYLYWEPWKNKFRLTWKILWGFFCCWGFFRPGCLCWFCSIAGGILTSGRAERDVVPALWSISGASAVQCWLLEEGWGVGTVSCLIHAPVVVLCVHCSALTWDNAIIQNWPASRSWLSCTCWSYACGPLVLPRWGMGTCFYSELSPGSTRVFPVGFAGPSLAPHLCH